MCLYRKVRELRWLAEATYTGEALEYSLDNTIKLMTHDNKVVIVLTDGRSDINRDKVPLNVLCGKDLRVSTERRYRNSERSCNNHEVPVKLKTSVLLSRWAV